MASTKILLILLMLIFQKAYECVNLNIGKIRYSPPAPDDDNQNPLLTNKIIKYPIIGVESKRPKSNFEDTQRDSSSTVQYGNEIYVYSGNRRSKRDSKNPGGFASMKKKFDEETKALGNANSKKEDLMAMDARGKDMNFTSSKFIEPQYGGMVTHTKPSASLNSKFHSKFWSETFTKSAAPVFCDFERRCSWSWKSNDFKVASFKSYDQPNYGGPKADASNSEDGHFLIMHVTTSNVTNITSPQINQTERMCMIKFSIFQKEMIDAEVNVIIDTFNHSKLVVARIPGNDNRAWETHEKGIGKKVQPFNIILEVVPPSSYIGKPLIAFDNINLLQCFPHSTENKSCRDREYQCNGTNKCINSSQVCDINVDCEQGDDEANCENIPPGARCNFEEDMCGWSNDRTKTLKWARADGSNRTAHAIENHTNKNTSGGYLHVIKPDNTETAFASVASLQSEVFNPPPRVHGNITSKYSNSCQIRFYLHQSGKHKSGLSIELTELGEKENKTTSLLWSYNSYESPWVRQVVTLPNITKKYTIQFDMKKGLRYLHTIAIDDVSLSPECFGLNIPPELLDGYDYWTYYTHDIVTEPHKSFVNKTFYEITTCGRRGRIGPSVHNCSAAYNNTPTKVEVMTDSMMRGVQKWRVPTEGYYTFILVGGSGGKGASAQGSSRGAMVRTVLELSKGKELYMLVGQEGNDACVKSLDSSSNSQCQSTRNNNHNSTGVRAIKNTKLTDGGGGGGGATFLFLYSKDKKKIPIAVAAGGGGIGLGKFIDTEIHHGQAINTSKPPETGTSSGPQRAGAGGGLKWGNYKAHDSPGGINGQSLIEGGQGGKACYLSNNEQGEGGFGGGGGGCVSGGGGGGYAGGNAYGEDRNMTNGDGGYSFIDTRFGLPQFSEARSAYYTGAGYVLIIPAIPGCDCDYRCVALDARRSHVVCICPKNWKLHQDGKQCLLIDEKQSYPTWFVGMLIGFILFLISIFGVMCVILYNRYQQRASEKLRRKMMSGPDFQLNSLRVASESLMTEYNPNYQFGGAVYTLKDLKDIPRDQLRLVKALGQGAFGEVYKGYFRQRTGDMIEMPVAVKTLPELSTNQAELDFLMEALIMSKFNHPNIVHFIGVCFDKHPRFIVLELLNGGDLKNFLRESRPRMDKPSLLTMKDLILIAQDVAKGCRYLEMNRFIHRDIAARNCLLTSKGPERAVKIADFGMSRDIYRSDYYRKGGKAMLPIKWMPPEAFLDGIFTTKTDVWSFGVLLWEIMSLGYMPYTGCANREVMALVTSGGRLEPPTNCPGPIYAIMTRCWHPVPENRPDFGLILERLDYCLQDPEVINAPLPVFSRPSSHERDVTVMRPSNDDDECLQVPQTTDYLIPNNSSMTQSVGSTSSVDKLLPDNSDSWETSFVLPHSRSTQPLLLEPEHNHIEDSTGSSEKLLDLDSNEIYSSKVSPISLTNNVNNHNNNVKTDLTHLKSGVSLDASALVKQAMKYANVNTGDTVTGNGIIQNGPYNNQNSYINNANVKNLLNDSEVTC